MDFSEITSREAVGSSLRAGRLHKIHLLPTLLGGKDIPENVAYVPRNILQKKIDSDKLLMEVVSSGMVEVSIIPFYRGDSYVPAKIVVSAAKPGLAPDYVDEIIVW